MCIWTGCDCFCAAGRMKRCRKLPRQELRHRIQRINMQARPRFCRYNLTKQDSHRSKQPCSCAKQRLSRIIEVTCNAARELAESQKTCSGQTSVPSRFDQSQEELRMRKKAAAALLMCASMAMWAGCGKTSNRFLYAATPGARSEE